MSPRGFVRSAPSKFDKHHHVAIRITDMVSSDALWWDTRLGPKHARLVARADRFWSWSVLLPLCHLVQLAKQRYCRPLVIWARNSEGRYLRAGMSIAIQDYPYLDVRHTLRSNFVWFISAADATVLKEDFAMSNPPALGRVLLDNAIVLSQNAGLGGRIGLHAAASGGEGLMRVYEQCGLTHLAAAAALPPSVGRRNDGRFFYANDEVAETLASLLDPSR